MGIYVYTDNNTINDNIIQNNVLGDLPRGIFIAIANNNSIYGNVIRKNEYGIYVWKYPKNTKIEQNLIENNSYGILVEGVAENTFISKNIIINNVGYGVSIRKCYYTIIEKNNIYKNHRDALFIVHAHHHDLYKFETTWNENYWGKIQLQSKIILGTLEIPYYSWPGEDCLRFIWLNFDWNPAREPYKIPGMS